MKNALIMKDETDAVVKEAAKGISTNKLVSIQIFYFPSIVVSRAFQIPIKLHQHQEPPQVLLRFMPHLAISYQDELVFIFNTLLVLLVFGAGKHYKF